MFILMKQNISMMRKITSQKKKITEITFIKDESENKEMQESSKEDDLKEVPTGARWNHSIR